MNDREFRQRPHAMLERLKARAALDLGEHLFDEVRAEYDALVGAGPEPSDRILTLDCAEIDDNGHPNMISHRSRTRIRESAIVRTTMHESPVETFIEVEIKTGSRFFVPRFYRVKSVEDDGRGCKGWFRSVRDGIEPSSPCLSIPKEWTP